MKPENTGKAVFYQNEITEELIFAVIRGDFEVNESKLQNITLASEIKFADDEVIRAAGCEPGYASPLAIDGTKVKIVVDRSVAESSNLVVGANEAHYHYKNFNFDRDLEGKTEVIVADIATVREGDPCPLTGQPLQLARGIEVGNIFQLGTKYTEAMNCTFLDQNGKANPMIMGCYGIGVGRSMASVMEQSNDQFGPIWPISIAPYQVQLCALNPKKENVAEVAEKIYEELLAAGIEVLFDDRGEKAGFMFNDADLIGIPLRLVLSPNTIGDGKIEFKRRGVRDGDLLDIEGIADKMKELIAEEYKKFQ
jgi:prolyl-tRNA synthetase